MLFKYCVGECARAYAVFTQHIKTATCAFKQRKGNLHSTALLNVGAFVYVYVYVVCVIRKY